ncbi:hypothetical protein EBR43_08620 [bacterium]|jgi:hypothetical protein|nr:hypothetical protein [bacterium]NBW57832.1 hypothetical protein [bacterium]NBX71836.1 hypothetical protein [bacterium]
MNWSSFNIFQRQCPDCAHTVPWSARKLLLKQTSIKCRHCKSLLTLHPRDRIVNLMFIGFFITQLNDCYFKEPTYFTELLLLLGVIFLDLPKYLNILFSLYKIPRTKIKYPKRQKSL